jgi:hypothetical protein
MYELVRASMTNKDNIFIQDGKIRLRKIIYSHAQIKVK